MAVKATFFLLAFVLLVKQTTSFIEPERIIIELSHATVPAKAPAHAPHPAPKKVSIHAPIKAPMPAPKKAPLHAPAHAPAKHHVHHLKKAPVHAPVKRPVHSPSKAPAPLVSPVTLIHGCVPMCEDYCKQISPKRPCMKVCTACCAKCKCVPTGSKKCTNWDRVMIHGAMVRCP